MLLQISIAQIMNWLLFSGQLPRLHSILHRNLPQDTNKKHTLSNNGTKMPQDFSILSTNQNIPTILLSPTLQQKRHINF